MVSYLKLRRLPSTQGAGFGNLTDCLTFTEEKNQNGNSILSPTGVLPHRLRFIFIHSDKPIDLIKRQTRIHLFK